MCAFRPIDRVLVLFFCIVVLCGCVELDHPSVVKLIEVFNSETHVFMAMEAVDGRELYEELMRQGRVDETRARDLFQQVGNEAMRQ